MAPRRTNKTQQSAKAKAFRLDIFRGAILVGGLICTLTAALYFATRAEPITTESESAIKQRARVGSITFMPLVGDNCRQAAFDNISGAIVPLDDVSCMQVINRLDAKTKPGSDANYFATIKENFRK